VVVETPADLSSKQRELLEQFAEASGESTNPQTRTFFEKVKQLFG
jgi:molecular chaperone DnaJ